MLKILFLYFWLLENSFLNLLLSFSHAHSLSLCASLFLSINLSRSIFLTFFLLCLFFSLSVIIMLHELNYALRTNVPGKWILRNSIFATNVFVTCCSLRPFYFFAFWQMFISRFNVYILLNYCSSYFDCFNLPGYSQIVRNVANSRRHEAKTRVSVFQSPLLFDASY